MNYISQYYYNIKKKKGKYNNIDTGDKWKVDASVPLIKLFSRKNIKDFESLNLVCSYS